MCCFNYFLKKAILGLALCAGLLFSAGTFSKHTSANAGLALCYALDYGSLTQVGVSTGTGVLGGAVGALIGGPFGMAIGAGLGAM